MLEAHTIGYWIEHTKLAIIEGLPIKREEGGVDLRIRPKIIDERRKL